MPLVGSNRCVDNDLVKSYDTTLKTVFELDPMAECGLIATDWDGYLHFRELAGSAVYYELRTVAGSVENVESYGSVSAYGTVALALSKTLKHRLYVKGYTSPGSIEIGYRINCYGMRWPW